VPAAGKLPAGGSVAADMLRIESASNIDNGVSPRMILLRQ
jgi:hypothetical protein